jgi:hypothetical protein
MEGIVASQGQMARGIRIKGLSLYKKVKGSGLFFDLPKHGAGRSIDGLHWDRIKGLSLY